MKTPHATTPATAHAASSAAASTARTARGGQAQDLFAQLLQSGLDLAGEEPTANALQAATTGAARPDAETAEEPPADLTNGAATDPLAPWLAWIGLPAVAQAGGLPAQAAAAALARAVPATDSAATTGQPGQGLGLGLGRSDAQGLPPGAWPATGPLVDSADTAPPDTTGAAWAPVSGATSLLPPSANTAEPGAGKDAAGTTATDPLAQAVRDPNPWTAARDSATAKETAVATANAEASPAVADAQATATPPRPGAETLASDPATPRPTPGRAEVQGAHWSRALDAAPELSPPSTQMLADAVAKAWHMSQPGQPGSAVPDTLTAAPTWGAAVSGLASGTGDTAAHADADTSSEPGGAGGAALLGSESADRLGAQPSAEADSFAMSLGEAMGDAYESLGAQVSLWAAANTKRASVRLDVGAAEALEVDVALDAGKAQLNFRTDDPQVREAIKAQAPAVLSELLARAGIALDSLSVGSQASGQSGGQHPDGQRGPWMALRPTADAAPLSPVRTPPTARGPQGLDVYA